MTRKQFAGALSYLPIYIACILLASLLWRTPTLLGICYVIQGALMLSRWHTRADITYFLLALVLGPVGEAIAIHFGAWRYTEPTLLVPIWLPLAWGISGLFLKKTTEALTATCLEGNRGSVYLPIPPVRPDILDRLGPQPVPE